MLTLYQPTTGLINKVPLSCIEETVAKIKIPFSLFFILSYHRRQVLTFALFAQFRWGADKTRPDLKQYREAEL
jgi:hypothetical protein